LVAAPAEQKRLRSNAVVSLHFTEEYVTAKKRRLYVDMTLEGFSNIEACVLSFRTGLDILELRDWQSAVSDIGDVLFAPVVRDGLGELFFGILVLDSYDGATTRIGRLVFDVLAGEPLDIGEDGFALVVGDVLVRDRGGNLVASELRSVVSRSLEANIARIYHNRLEQNFPNPFNPSTTIAYSLESRAGVSLIIYDVAGRRVRDLVNEIRNPGVYRVKWNGRNDNGQPVASGVYFYKLVAGSFTDTKKMTVLK
ncbi:MAG: T9SS type A sorting domain-containing protein, partial [Gemmatimonadota bacterium]|nr:T9SS type A sorting domain-containing protein [Gemmatimonadota bacterium]